jgi:hypothetical protein
LGHLDFYMGMSLGKTLYGPITGEIQEICHHYMPEILST